MWRTFYHLVLLSYINSGDVEVQAEGAFFVPLTRNGKGNDSLPSKKYKAVLIPKWKAPRLLRLGGGEEKEETYFPPDQ